MFRPAFNHMFTNLWDKNENGTLEIGYWIRNGLATFHQFRQDPVFIRYFPVFKSGNIPFSIQTHSVEAAQ
jgi:hypothetical protein